VDLVDARTDGLKLSLKLYHGLELRSDCQHLITEAPNIELALLSLDLCKETIQITEV